MIRMKNKLCEPIGEKLIAELPEDAIIDVNVFEYSMGILPPKIAIKYVAIASGVKYSGAKSIRISHLTETQQFRILEAALLTLQG